MGDAADDLSMREQNERLPYSDFNPRGYKKTVKIAKPKPELSLSEILLEVLIPYVEESLPKGEFITKQQLLESPKVAQALHSLQVKLLEARLVELDLLEQFLNRESIHGSMPRYKILRLTDLEDRIKQLKQEI